MAMLISYPVNHRDWSEDFRCLGTEAFVGCGALVRVGKRSLFRRGLFLAPLSEDDPPAFCCPGCGAVTLLPAEFRGLFRNLPRQKLEWDELVAKNPVPPFPAKLAPGIGEEGWETEAVCLGADPDKEFWAVRGCGARLRVGRDHLFRDLVRFDGCNRREHVRFACACGARTTLDRPEAELFKDLPAREAWFAARDVAQPVVR